MQVDDVNEVEAGSTAVHQRLCNSVTEPVENKSGHLPEFLNLQPQQRDSSDLDYKTGEVGNDLDDSSSDNDLSGDDSDDVGPAYCIQSLRNDLKKSPWRQGWTWSSNSEGVTFVQLTKITLQPRIHCFVDNDLEINMSVADKSYHLQLDERVQALQDVTDCLDGLESLEVCVGTGHDKEK